MKIEMCNPKKLIPYEINPRNNERAIEPVMNSIREFGFKQPVVVDKNDIIVVGHTRIKAAIELGLKEVPVIKANDLTPEQIKAFRLADNKTAEFANWNFELLDDELINLKNIDFNMEQFGFFESDENYIDNFFDDEKNEQTSEQKGDDQDENHILIRFDLSTTDEDDIIEVLKEHQYSFEILKR